MATPRPDPPSPKRLPAALLVWGLLAGVWLAVSPGFAQPPTGDPPAKPPEAAAADWVEVGRASGEGERCLVCRLAIDGEEAVAVRYKGRTFHVKASMLATFAGDPDHYFEELQARGALFDERAMEGRSVSPFWLALGGYMLVGLVCAAFCGAVAIGRGLEPLPWFFAGLVGNLAALFVLMLGRQRGSADAPDSWTKVRTTHAPSPCHACGAENHPSATACNDCGARLDPAFESEAGRTEAGRTEAEAH